MHISRAEAPDARHDMRVSHYSSVKEPSAWIESHAGQVVSNLTNIIQQPEHYVNPPPSLGKHGPSHARKAFVWSLDFSPNCGMRLRLRGICDLQCDLRLRSAMRGVCDTGDAGDMPLWNKVCQSVRICIAGRLQERAQAHCVRLTSAHACDMLYAEYIEVRADGPIANGE